MRSFAWGRRQLPVLPMAVTLLQVALVTWIPVADAVHHSGNHPVTPSGESGGGHGDGSALAPVCFICAAGLGASLPKAPQPTPAVFTDRGLSNEPTFEALPPTHRVPTTLPRGPPLA